MTLFRAMSPAEWTELQSLGEFLPGPPSYQGKWFAETKDDAVQWGRQLHQNSTVGFVVVAVGVPQDVADQFFRLAMLDGIGPARFADIEQLPLLNELSIRLVATIP